MNIKTIASAVLAAVVLCAAPAFADGKMNLNTATEQELSANPAVGPELAKGIVEFRENVGDIKSMDELLEVKGVTPEVLEKLKQAVPSKPRRRGRLVLTLIAGGPGKGFPHRTAAEADKNSNRIASRLHSEGG